MKAACGFAALCATSLLLTAAPARADGFVSPTIGVDFGGNAGDTLRGAANDSKKINFGAAAGWMGEGIVGVEEDFSYAPNFYGDGGTVDKTRVLTLMTNLILGVPVGGQHGPGIRPFASAGVGLIGRNITFVNGLNNFSANDFGFDLGAGVMGYFSNNIGLRFDYRYFRNFQSTDSNTIGLEAGHFSFSRASLGVLFRF
jgi:opacity protein-like surface antigen